ncbi:MAG: uroporphyrinogen-III C-methyltransferase, partial [Pseudomonas sp.]
RPNQQVVRCTLRQLPSMADEQQLTPPTLTVIGRVVGLFAERQLEHPARLHGDPLPVAEALCN